MNLTPYNTASAEELNRRSAIINEIEKLYDITHKSIIDAGYNINTIHTLQKTSIDLLNHDMQLVRAFNEYITEDKSLKPSFPLKTNKLFELFNCATDVLQQKITAFMQHDMQASFPMKYNTSTILGGSDTALDIKGTSAANCLQTALLSMLRIIKSADKLSDLKLENIYNVDISPVIQGTAMPEHFNDTFMPDFKQWFFYYSDDQSPPQGELLVPTLGYAFGGSRQDARYSKKIFKTQDCSSAISQWLQATVEFSTLDMARAFNNTCTDYGVTCKEVQRVLTPLEGLQDVVHGDVFIYRTLSGGHTGFVAQKINDTCFDALSYSRNMPKVEGLGYNVFCEEDGKQYMYFTPKQNLEIEGYCDVLHDC